MRVVIFGDSDIQLSVISKHTAAAINRMSWLCERKVRYIKRKAWTKHRLLSNTGTAWSYWRFGTTNANKLAAISETRLDPRKCGANNAKTVL